MNAATADLEERVALVTGAGRGLGWGVAVALARAGAAVCVADIDAGDAQRTVDDIVSEGGDARAEVFDASDADAFRAAVDATVGAWGRIDAMVHAAIYMPLVRFGALDDADWRRQLDVGLGGFYHGVRACWEPMVRQGGGHLIGIASGSSLRGYPEEVAYCTVKHGLEGMVKALALETEALGLAINTVGPGAEIKPTRMTWDQLEALPAAEKAAWADPRDLGRAFAWLIAQDPGAWSGLRFDAGPIRDTLDREGIDFLVEPEKVTLYPDDFRTRVYWRDAMRQGAA